MDAWMDDIERLIDGFEYYSWCSPPYLATHFDFLPLLLVMLGFILLPQDNKSPVARKEKAERSLN